LNLHGLLHYHLKVARLPIPPYAQHKVNCRNALTAWQPAHCQRFWWQVKRFLNSEKEIWHTTPGGTNWHHNPTIVGAGENAREPNPALAAAAAAAAGGIDVKNATGEIALDFSTLLGRAKAHVTKTPSQWAKPEEMQLPDSKCVNIFCKIVWLRGGHPGGQSVVCPRGLALF
jgi:hypothetical protein